MTVTDEKQSGEPKVLDPLRNVPRVADPVPEPGERTPDGRVIKRDANGYAYTESSPFTGGIRTYLDENEYPPELPEGESAPPPIALVPPQAAAAAESEFAPHPPVDQAAVQTSTTQEPIAPAPHAAPEAGVPTFSTNEAAAAAAQKTTAPATGAGEAPSDKAQAVIDAVLQHPAAQPKAGQ